MPPRSPQFQSGGGGRNCTECTIKLAEARRKVAGRGSWITLVKIILLLAWDGWMEGRTKRTKKATDGCS